MTDTITAQQLRFDRMLDAPVDTVWRYLIEPDLRARWFMGGETEPRVGGKFGLTFDHDQLSDGDAPMPERYAEECRPFAGSRRSSGSSRRTCSPSRWDNGEAGSVTVRTDADRRRPHAAGADA